MDEKNFAAARIQYEHTIDLFKNVIEETDKEWADLLLRVMKPMSYEVWKYLHEVKGDWIE